MTVAPQKRSFPITVPQVESHRQAAGRWKKRNPEAVKAQNRRSNIMRHGITPERYDEMFADQHGLCAICWLPSQRALDIDHDHKCCPGKRSCGGCVRGLLCWTCNKGIGQLQDDPDLLRSAAEYLERL